MAEDVLQDCYLKIVDGRARFGQRAAFRTFLFGVIRLTAANRRRRMALRRMIPFASMEDRDVTAVAEDPVPDSVDVDLLRAALRTLSARQQETLHLVFYQDMTIAEAAVVMGVSVGTARTHYERGKQALRAALGDEQL